jgi:hypothetical protein
MVVMYAEYVTEQRLPITCWSNYVVLCSGTPSDLTRAKFRMLTSLSQVEQISISYMYLVPVLMMVASDLTELNARALRRR